VREDLTVDPKECSPRCYYALRKTMLNPSTGLEPWAAPLIRWAGSKRQLLPRLMPLMPDDFSRYFEPFLGSGCLFFALRPKKAILGDMNSDLMSAYSILAAHPRLLHEAVASMPNTSAFYYQLRSSSNLGSPLENAARFVYLNRFSFNGVFRCNRAGLFNVPRGTQTGRVPEIKRFSRCAYALRNAELRAGDFEDSLRDAARGDFVYLDPPYAKKNARYRGEYGYGSFKVADIDRLFRLLTELDRRGAKFLLSYSYCREIRPAMQHWHSRLILVQRHVAGFRRHRGQKREILIANYPLR
jgi:DNA adenine methylase